MKLKMNYSFYFYFYFLLKFFVNCQQCSGCKVVSNICTHENEFHKTCDPDCRPNLSSNNPICYKCTNIEPGQKYSFTNKNKCTINPNANNCKFMAFNSKQCFTKCPSNLSTMGNFCYPDCNNENRAQGGAVLTCKCKSYYYTETVDKKILYHCLNYNCESSHQTYSLSDLQCSSDNKCKEGLKKNTNIELINRI